MGASYKGIVNHISPPRDNAQAVHENRHGTVRIERAVAAHG